MAHGYGNLSQISQMTLAQFYGALKACNKAELEKTKDLIYCMRVAQADAKSYKAAIKKLSES